MDRDVIASPDTPPDRREADTRPGPAPDIAELFRAHHLELVRLALLIVGDLPTAEDVVQDAFEQLQQRWHGLRRKSSGLDYARSTVLNACRSVLRRRGVARRHAPRIAAGDRQAAEAAAAAANAVDFELRSELFEAFRTLPRRQREVLAFRYYLDASVAETARALRISEGTVRSTASRGLDSLARIMTSRGPKEA